MKIGHLRMLPAPKPSAVEVLATLGVEPGQRGAGIADAERDQLDTIASQSLGLSQQESAFIVAWARANPPPAQRGASEDR